MTSSATISESAAGISGYAVAMAADAGYLIPTLVAVDSLLLNAAADQHIDLYCIVPDDDRELFENSLAQIISYHRKGTLHLLSPGSEFKDVETSISHITAPTYYRLALPELLQDADCCLYLDGDTIVQEDLSQIVDSLSSDDLIAGVKAAAYYWPEKNREANRERLGISDFSSYVNAGVLAMNLQLMRELECPSAFKALVPLGFSSQDQDIINKVCHDRCRVLPPRFNLMTKYHPELDDSYDTNPCLSTCYTAEEWREARLHPAIVHYADKLKPWQSDQMDLANLWWERAEEASERSAILHGSLPLIKRSASLLSESRRLLQDKTAECAHLQQSLTETIAKKNSIESERKRLDIERQNQNRALEQCREENARLISKITEVESHLACAQQNIRKIRASNSWKIGRAITFPMRKCKLLFRRLFDAKS